MKIKFIPTVGAAWLSFATLILQPAAADAQGTAFTYQGRLDSAGAPYTGNAEFQATLWSAVSAGSQIAASSPAQVVVGVTNGLFVLPLDFGGNFPGADRWLQLEVRTAIGAFTSLTPRQPVTATPYAITAGHLTGPLPAGQLSGAVPSANLGGTYSSALTLNNAANSFTGNGAGLTSLPASQLTSGTVPDARLAANVARTNQVWLLGGNAGTTPGMHFLGTSGNQALEFKVNGRRALRLEPTLQDGNHLNIVNVVAGSPDNSVASNVFGATIGGGGAVQYLGIFGPNRVESDFGTVAGGLQNTIESSALAATISGGLNNTIQTNADYATIPGGRFNTATNYALAAGYRAKANHTGAFVWGDSQNPDFASQRDNQFRVRADGGARFDFNAGEWVDLRYQSNIITSARIINTSSGGYLSLGGTWVNASDRERKTHFTPVDPQAMLAKVAAMPLSEWSYRIEGESVRHVGPMAQDFQAAFGLGADDKSIATVDADGVALAAIQGLNQKLEAEVKSKDARIAELEKRLAAIESLLQK